MSLKNNILFLLTNHCRLVNGLLIFLILSVCPALAKEPLEVGVSLKIHQVTEINQKAESFSVVATLIMEWNDPELAAESSDEDLIRMYLAPNFLRLMEERGLIWPAHSFYNLQGRWSYKVNNIVIIIPGTI